MNESIEPASASAEPRYLFGKPVPAEVAAALTKDPSTVQMIPLQYVSVEDGFNARDFDMPENKDHIKRLSSLISEHGVETPLRVRLAADRLTIVDGECRIRAVHQAKDGGSKIKEVPCLLDPDSDDERKRVASLIVKNTGKPFSMLEALNVVSRMRSLDVPAAQIQSSLGFSRTHLANLNLLGQATPKVQELVRKGRISASTVVDMIREYKDAPEAVESSIEKAVKKVEQREARGTGPKERVTRQNATDGVLYTKGNFDRLIRMLQELRMDMTPAAQYRKFRTRIGNTLEDLGASVEPEPEEEAKA